MQDVFPLSGGQHLLAEVNLIVVHSDLVFDDDDDDDDDAGGDDDDELFTSFDYTKHMILWSLFLTLT